MKTILFIVDRPNWAHDHKAQNIIAQLKDSYQFKINYHDALSDTDLLNADLVLIFYWIQLRSQKKLRKFFKTHPYKCVIGICSHWEITNLNALKSKRFLKKANAIFAHNPRLLEDTKKFRHPNLYYTPNGVDCSFFVPKKTPPNITLPLNIGWAQNPLGTHKNYSNVLKPAFKSLSNARLIESGQNKTHAEMKQFYQSLDLYICTSSTEGTPNPCLEAAACGIPIITTPVGNMPELITDNENGFFIAPTIEEIHNVLKKIETQPTRLNDMQTKIRASALDFDWEKQAQHYHTLFQESLNRISKLKHTQTKTYSKLFSFIKKQLGLQ